MNTTHQRRFPEAETARTRIRRFRPDDLGEFLAYRSDPALHFYGGTHLLTREEAAAFLEEQASRPAGVPGVWNQIAIEHRETNELIGDFGLKIWSSSGQEAELGYRMWSKYQRQGLTTEAARALLDILFREWGIHRIVAYIEPENQPSIRVAEKLGFRREGTMLESYFTRGQWVNEHIYAILEREWL
jgi:RimJ/RimL family protein N-acetyltransferase